MNPAEHESESDYWTRLLTNTESDWAEVWFRLMNSAERKSVSNSWTRLNTVLMLNPIEHLNTITNWVSSKQHYLIEIDAKKVFFRISKCTFWFFITCHIARHTNTMIMRGDYIIYEYRPYYVCLCTCCTFIYTLIRFSSICLSNVLFLVYCTEILFKVCTVNFSNFSY